MTRVDEVVVEAHRRPAGDDGASIGSAQPGRRISSAVSAAAACAATACGPAAATAAPTLTGWPRVTGLRRQPAVNAAK